MNVIEGLRANYQGKVLARAIRAVKEQGTEHRRWKKDLDNFTWVETKEGHYYWWAVCYNKPNPDQYLLDGYVDVEEESPIHEAREMAGQKIARAKAVIVSPTCQTDFIKQSEQLKAFADYAQKRMWEDGDKDLSEFVDEFLNEKTEQVSPWISVEERLPESGQCVLLYSPKIGVREGAWISAKGHFEQWRWNAILTNVSHWMELPKPPKTTEK